MRNFIYFILSSCFLTSNSFALQIYPTLGPDILGIKDGGVSFAYHVYYNDGKSDGSMKIDNLPVLALDSFFDGFNNQFGLIIPCNSAAGSPSTISFGYVENKKTTYPVTCQKIILNDRHNMQIYFNREGCIAS